MTLIEVLKMKSFFKVLIKVLLILFLILILVSAALYIYVRITGHDNKYITKTTEEQFNLLDYCYYDISQKALVFSLSDEVIASYFKMDVFKKEMKKFDLKINAYGFDMKTEKSEVWLYIKAVYREFLPLDGYIIFDYRIEGGYILMDVQEIKIEKLLTVTLEKLQQLNVNTHYKFRYPKIEISQMITIDNDYLTIDSYDNDTLTIKYNLFDYIYDYYKFIYENSDESYYIYKTIEKYGLDNYVESNYPYVVAELEDYGIEIR